MKLMCLLAMAGSLLLTVIWATSSSSTSAEISLATTSRPLSGKIRKHDREAQRRLMGELRQIIRTLRRSLQGTIHSSTSHLLHHLSQPHGESAQYDLIKEWATALHNTLKTSLTDAHGDVRDAVKRRWEALEGPVKKRRNAFDPALPAARPETERPREFGRARLPGLRELGGAAERDNIDL